MTSKALQESPRWFKNTFSVIFTIFFLDSTKEMGEKYLFLQQASSNKVHKDAI